MKEENKYRYMKKISFLIVAFFAVFGVLFAFQQSRAVTISQLLPEFVASPGETIEQVIQLYDDSKQGVTVYPTVYNFTADPAKEGAVLILTDEKDLKPDREWIKFEQKEVQLPKEGTLIDFAYSIEIPEGAEPGTHLISIVFQTKPAPSGDQKDGAAVYIGTNVATNIFLKVLGTTIDKIEVDLKTGTFTNKDPQLSAAEKIKSFIQKTFFLKPPVDFSLKVKNTGNTHQKPDGNIKIVNDLLGGDAEKLVINSESRIVLPGTERSFDVPSFGQGFMFGKYRATLTLLYGDPLRPVEQVVTFWIVPVVEIAITLGIIILIIITIIIIVKSNKKRREKKDKEREDRLRKEIMDQMSTPKQQPAAPVQQQIVKKKSKKNPVKPDKSVGAK